MPSAMSVVQALIEEELPGGQVHSSVLGILRNHNPGKLYSSHQHLSVAINLFFRWFSIVESPRHVGGPVQVLPPTVHHEQAVPRYPRVCPRGGGVVDDCSVGPEGGYCTKTQTLVVLRKIVSGKYIIIR